ncbi:transmembrane protein, putative (macronuclear) [Tetrahymena thermophila SB210]|uniref:Transmembrane protein, putative n=1 Tax=Tetrahymena thermophila (strain SB210) TaxID=312017 RepID=W7XAI7_TETTS|nr:transmembrane protein, putative [Tetrahymena thermophila SB210]EWS73418.1 transmembrane protein, putative [Tetrahymena thermophila SB210]|eukprot:XP_012654034.1 transmembrane protein, putative [Tetrahymena thermophila SB210]
MMLLKQYFTQTNKHNYFIRFTNVVWEMYFVMYFFMCLIFMGSLTKFRKLITSFFWRKYYHVHYQFQLLQLQMPLNKEFILQLLKYPSEYKIYLSNLVYCFHASQCQIQYHNIIFFTISNLQRIEIKKMCLICFLNLLYQVSMLVIHKQQRKSF